MLRCPTLLLLLFLFQKSDHAVIEFLKTNLSIIILVKFSNQLQPEGLSDLQTRHLALLDSALAKALPHLVYADCSIVVQIEHPESKL